MRTHVLAAAVIAAIVPFDGALAQTAKYPTRPVRVIVPYAPGGGADIVARVIALKMSETLRQSVVIDNRAGAGGAIGSEMAARAVPDGYTLAFVSGAYTTGVALIKPPYDPVNDITPIVLVGEASSLLVVHPTVPIKSVKELIDYAKANPGKLNYGSGGTGGFSHLIAAYFELMANVRMTHIPYKGTGPALTDLLGGQLQVIIGSTPSDRRACKVRQSARDRRHVEDALQRYARGAADRGHRSGLLRAAAVRHVGPARIAEGRGVAVEHRGREVAADRRHERAVDERGHRCRRRTARGISRCTQDRHRALAESHPRGQHQAGRLIGYHCGIWICSSHESAFH